LRSVDFLTGMTFLLADKLRHAQNLNGLCPLYDTSAFKKSLNIDLTVIYIITKHTLLVRLPVVATAQL
jgi:hypothetical protein